MAVAWRIIEQVDDTAYTCFVATLHGTLLTVKAKAGAAWPAGLPAVVTHKAKDVEEATKLCTTLDAFILAWADTKVISTIPIASKIGTQAA